MKTEKEIREKLALYKSGAELMAKDGFFRERDDWNELIEVLNWVLDEHEACEDVKKK